MVGTIPTWADGVRSWQISAPYTLPENVVAHDITCNHSKLSIHAEVTGQIFAVECDLVIGKNSLLHRGVIFSGGNVRIEDNADIFGDVTQIGGELWLDPGANLRGTVHRYQQSVRPPTPFLHASQNYLTFRRIVPNDLEHLFRVAQELQLKQMEQNRTPLETFKIPNFLEFLFQKEQIRFAQKWTYEKNHYPIEFQIMQFASSEKAFRFWTNILTFTNLNLEHSIQNSLGDGGHWFFRFQNRSTLLWHRTNWIFSAQVYGLSTLEDGVNWISGEAELEDFIRLFQEALLANAQTLDVGDMFISSDN